MACALAAVHIPFWCSGGSVIEYFLSSTLLSVANDHLFTRIVSRKMSEHVPHGDVVRYGPSPRQEMGVFRPHKASPKNGHPVLFYFHGGAFLIGGRQFGNGIAAWAAQNGMVGISVGYTLANDARWKGTKTALRDALDAIRYVHDRHEDFGIRAPQTILMGESAGGAIALMASHALMNQGVTVAATVCSWSMTTLDARYYIPMKIGAQWRETSPESIAASPSAIVGMNATQEDLKRSLTRLGLYGRRARGWLAARYFPKGRFVIPSIGRMPPTLLLCAERDRITPFVQQQMFAESMPWNIELATFESSDHGEGAMYCSAGRLYTHQFLKRHVRGLSRGVDKVGESYVDAQTTALGLQPHKFTRRIRPFRGKVSFKRV